MIRMKDGNELKVSEEGYRHGSIIAVNQLTRIASALAEQMAGTDQPVVIYGTIGTGKHLFARKIHDLGPRQGEPFVWLSCVAGQGPDYMKTALDEAGAGTVYLDCMNELAPECLNVIRLISGDDYKKRFRLVAGIGKTQDELYQEPNEITDLLDQMRCCVIELPKLSARQDEIEALATYHLARLCCEQGEPMKQLSPEFIKILRVYPWPGNVRELVNTLEQVIITAGDKKTLFARDLPHHIRIKSLPETSRDKIGL